MLRDKNISKISIESSGRLINSVFQIVEIKGKEKIKIKKYLVFGE